MTAASSAETVDPVFASGIFPILVGSIVLQTTKKISSKKVMSIIGVMSISSSMRSTTRQHEVLFFVDVSASISACYDRIEVSVGATREGGRTGWIKSVLRSVELPAKSANVDRGRSRGGPALDGGIATSL